MADPETKPQDNGQASYGNSGETPAVDVDPNDTHRTDTGIGKPGEAAQGSDGGGDLTE
ncbi:MAG: hypothetical protein PGN09_09835 [Sphingomonas fennica]